MYPYLFTIPYINYSVSTFGVMMILGFLFAYALTMREFPRRGVDPSMGVTFLSLSLLGGLLGAKAYFATDMMFRAGGSWVGYFVQRDGMTWYGGLAGAVLICWVYCRSKRIPFRGVLESTSVAVAVGQAFGRVGCFFVGDDYGYPTSVSWAVAFPNGQPPTLEAVHPTQLYEVLWLVPVALFLHRRRETSPFLFGEYLALNGLGRFFIEMYRINPKVALGLSEPQLIGILLVAVGVVSSVFYWIQEKNPAAMGPQEEIGD